MKKKLKFFQKNTPEISPARRVVIAATLLTKSLSSTAVRLRKVRIITKPVTSLKTSFGMSLRSGIRKKLNKLSYNKLKKEPAPQAVE